MENYEIWESLAESWCDDWDFPLVFSDDESVASSPLDVLNIYAVDADLFPNAIMRGDWAFAFQQFADHWSNRVKYDDWRSVNRAFADMSDSNLLHLLRSDISSGFNDGNCVMVKVENEGGLRIFYDLSGLREFLSEAVDWSDIEFDNNDSLMRALEDSNGIFSDWYACDWYESEKLRLGEPIQSPYD